MSNSGARGYIKSVLLWLAMTVPVVLLVTALTVGNPTLGAATSGAVGLAFGALTGVVAVRLGWVE